MSQRPVYAVSGAANDYRAYVLCDKSNALDLVERRWGRRMAGKWTPPRLTTVAETASLPDADFSSVYVPNLLLANKPAVQLVSGFEVELLPARVGSEERFFLNFLLTLKRFRDEDADVARVPSGAILLMRRANFYAQDIPDEPRAFWFHDGNAPRFLLCNHEFKNVVSRSRSTGLSFQRVGYAH